MKRLFIALLLAGSIAAAVSAESIKVPGFGTIEVQKRDGIYIVPLGKLGTFEFTGSISPSAFQLKSSLPLSKLQNFPGFSILKELSLSDVSLTLSTAGLELKGKAETKGKLGTLFKFLRVPNPSLDLTAMITTSSLDLKGSLMFGQSGISIPIIPPLGTVFNFSGLTIQAVLGGSVKGGVSAAVMELVGDFRMKPTKWDPALKLQTKFTYDLFTQELKAAGSMIDTWENPLGLSRILNEKQKVSIKNAAVDIAWIPGSPSPTKIGIMAERVQFFNFVGGFALDINPTDAKAAFKIDLPNLTLNELQNFVSAALGKKLPNIFSKSFGLKNAKILFSPNGGTVGAFEIAQGFELKGEANLGASVSGFVDIYADFERGIRLAGGFDSNLNKLILDKLNKMPMLKPIISKVLSTFSIKKAEVLMKASTSDFGGELEVECSVMGKRVAFKIAASFDPEAVAEACAKKIYEEIKELAVDVYAEAKEVAGAAYSETKDAVNKGADEVWKGMKTLATTLKHGSHSFNTCINDCVPSYAKRGGEKMYATAEQAVRSFADKVLPKLQKVTGKDANETRALRAQTVKESYDRLLAEIDGKFKSLKDDKEVRKFFTMGGSKDKGEKKYEGMIQEYWDKYRRFANEQYNKLIG